MKQFEKLLCISKLNKGHLEEMKGFSFLTCNVSAIPWQTSMLDQGYFIKENKSIEICYREKSKFNRSTLKYPTFGWQESNRVYKLEKKNLQSANP